MLINLRKVVDTNASIFYRNSGPKCPVVVIFIYGDKSDTKPFVIITYLPILQIR